MMIAISLESENATGLVGGVLKKAKGIWTVVLVDRILLVLSNGSDENPRIDTIVLPGDFLVFRQQLLIIHEEIVMSNF